MSMRYRRNPDVTAHEVGAVAFLAHPETGEVSKLSETGTALWRLLVEPLDVEDAVAVFLRAFPAEDTTLVEESVRGLFDVFIEDGLVEEAR